jgi:hypothetical protein
MTRLIFISGGLILALVLASLVIGIVALVRVNHTKNLAQGPKGDQGPQGPQGPKGEPGNLSMPFNILNDNYSFLLSAQDKDHVPPGSEGKGSNTVIVPYKSPYTQSRLAQWRLIPAPK